MRRATFLGTAALLLMGSIAMSSGAQAAPVSADPLVSVSRHLAPTVEVKSRKVYRRHNRRQVIRRHRAYPYAYGRSIDVIPRRSYRRPGAWYSNGGRGDGGFIRGQQTQGITH